MIMGKEAIAFVASVTYEASHPTLNVEQHNNSVPTGQFVSDDGALANPAN